MFAILILYTLILRSGNNIAILPNPNCVTQYSCRVTWYPQYVTHCITQYSCRVTWYPQYVTHCVTQYSCCVTRYPQYVTHCVTV